MIRDDKQDFHFVGLQEENTDTIGGFHAISGDTNNNGEMNKCWWTNKAS